MNKILKNEDGGALLLALMVLLVLSTLGLTVGTVTVGSYRLGDSNREFNSTYYIAEAGANMAYEELKKDVNTVYNASSSSDFFYSSVDALDRLDTGKKYTDFETQFGSDPYAEVVIKKDTDGGEGAYIIHSTGVIDGKERVVEKKVEVNWVPKNTSILVNAAIIFNGKVTFKNDAKVVGDIIHDGSGEIDNKSDYINTIKPVPTLDWSVYENYVKSFEDIPTSDWVNYGDWKLDGVVEISTNGETVNAKADTLNFKDGSIAVTGGGTVNLYLKNPTGNNAFNNHNVLTQNSDGKLNIIYAGTDEFVLGNGISGVFTIFAPNATVTLINGASVNGSIVAKNVEFNNSANITFPEGEEYETPGDNDDDENSGGDLISSKPAVEN